MQTLRIVVISLVVVLSVALSAAEVPSLISYQGRLNDSGGTPVNGSVNFEFRIYDVASGGTELWSENQTIVVSNGIFNVELGAVTPIPLSALEASELHLGVRAGADQEMTPRQRLISSAYTRVAETTDTVKAGTVSAAQAGRDDTIVSFYGETATTVELTVVPVDQTLVITDIKCSPDSTGIMGVTLSYDEGSGDITAYKVTVSPPYSGAIANLLDTFRSGIPIPPGASLKLARGSQVSSIKCTVAGFLIPVG